MVSFRNLSLRNKQTLIIMLTCTVSLLVACGAFLAYDVSRFRREMVESTASLAEVLGNGTTAAIDFNRPEEASQTLGALRGEPNIVMAHVYTPNGQIFASYLREGAQPPRVIPHSLETRDEFTATHLYLFRPITQGGERVGTIELIANLDKLQVRLWRYAGIAGLVLTLSLLAAFGLSSRLQKLVSDPILRLAQVARSVAQEKNYSVRVPKQSHDELGQLVDGFNDMLGQIQGRDAALQRAREELEARVVERTAELASANQALQNEVGERERAQVFLNSVLEYLPIPVFIKEAKELRFVLWNKAGEQLTGIPNAEMIGRNDCDFFPEKDAERNVANDRAAFENKGLLEIPEEIIQTRDHGARIVHVRKVPIFDAAGQPAFLLGICEDITERKRAAEALQQSEERNRMLVEESPDVIGIYQGGNLVFINSIGIQMFGANAGEELLGRTSKQMIHPDDYADAMSRIQRRLAGEKGLYPAEVRYLDVAGTAVPMEVSAAAITFGGKPAVQFIARDIGERKRAQLELEITHKQLLSASRRAGMAEIATNVLHNVGNVLNSVNVSTDLIVRSVRKSRASGLSRVVVLLQEHAHDLGEFVTNDSKGKQLPVYLAQLSEHLLADQAAIISELDLLRRNVEHIKEIVAMQQDYARVGGVKEMVNVVQLVEDSLRMNESALSRHHVEVIREFENVPPMNVDKHKILQILVNLVRNAQHACDDSEGADKRLTVRVAKGPGRVSISVMDNGVGIPSENLTRIFNHGFTTRKGGHGFGLHSGALAAREMGGSLTVHSDGLGRGAIFTLKLPLNP